MNPPVRRIVVPFSAGVTGAVFLASVYLGIVSLAESPRHALDLLWEDKTFVVPIILGFGTQVGLYTFLRKGLYMPLYEPVAGATTAAGGGVSTVAMVACCAHHVTDLLPLVGLTAAATLLANWKVPFMVGGLALNLAGIGLMLRNIREARRHAVARSHSLEAVS